jgi:hypothetical protein
MGLPGHCLLLVECDLRERVTFLRYPEGGQNYRIDISAPIVATGKKELGQESLLAKRPLL